MRNGYPDDEENYIDTPRYMPALIGLVLLVIAIAGFVIAFI